MKHNVTVPIQSIYEIARKAKVSVATVSRVLNNKESVRQSTRVRILDIINKNNYKPRLVKAKTLNIGILIQAGAELFGNYLAEVINGIFDYCIEFDYNLQLFSFYEKRLGQKGILNTLRENKIDGMIVLLSNKNSDYVIQAQQEKYPVILINKGLDATGVNYIDIDNARGIKEALQYLKDMGHSRISFLSGDLQTRDHVERLNAFKKYMKQDNKNFRNDQVIDFIRPDLYLTSFEQGYQQMKEVLKKHKNTTAVLANNDDQAIGAIKAMGEAGISVPEDISIIGFDDYKVSAYTNPALTSIHQPLFKMGRMAAAKLITIITGASIELIQEKMNPELIIRDSVSPCKKKRVA
ncbi:MAG: LacI family transcriptional regulator [Spirochaetes bacterium]|nr:LacI family transcriptional regulator [Spirochaetota bacterium]